MIAIIDYDAGNIKSVQKAFQFLGQDAVITSDPKRILSAERVILPGVGNFGDAMHNLTRYGMEEVIHGVVEKEIPFLGICVGMQLLFEGSEESPGVAGLGLLKGRCHKFRERPGMKVPQIGWNSLQIGGEETEKTVGLFKDIRDGSFVYFVHSYYILAEDESLVTAKCDYGVTFHAAVQKGNLFATQFHPEKSGDLGMNLLHNFLETTGRS